jgi:hypothetical protein
MHSITDVAIEVLIPVNVDLCTECLSGLRTAYETESSSCTEARNEAEILLRSVDSISHRIRNLHLQYPSAVFCQLTQTASEGYLRW